MAAFDELQNLLKTQPSTWLVTGAAGFIGSNLVEHLLRLKQNVVGMDNFATGHQYNLHQIEELVDEDEWNCFRFIEGDIRSYDECLAAFAGVDLVLHQGALGSVPRSIEDPIGSHDANVSGTVHMLQAASKSGIKRFVYASSSSVYGDSPTLPKIESEIGECLSPYAATKLADEIYAGVFAKCYGIQTVGLRYFNVFGPRQDPNGAYAAVIPKWIAAMLEGEDIFINGDGETSRDFCHVKNVIQANLLAATQQLGEGSNQTFNVAVGDRTTLNELFFLIRDSLKQQDGCGKVADMEPTYRDFRDGDVRHSLADISLISDSIGYEPTHDIYKGMNETVAWYVQDYHRRKIEEEHLSPPPVI